MVISVIVGGGKWIRRNGLTISRIGCSAWSKSKLLSVLSKNVAELN